MNWVINIYSSNRANRIVNNSFKYRLMEIDNNLVELIAISASNTPVTLFISSWSFNFFSAVDSNFFNSENRVIRIYHVVEGDSLLYLEVAVVFI